MRVKIKGLKFNQRYVLTFDDTTRFYYEFVFSRKEKINVKICYHDLDGVFLGDLTLMYRKKELKEYIKDDDILVHEYEKGLEYYFTRFPLVEE